MSSYIWQDREIRFDCGPKDLRCRSGEFLVDTLEHIEDTKGNNGEKGIFEVTNLRLVWRSKKNIRTNLSIGYNCVLNITTHSANSRLRGNTQALFVLTKYSGSRFEFIFTNLVRNSPRLFTTVQAVFRSYETSKLFRDLKLRAAIIKNKELVLLSREQIVNKVSGVWNLSSDQGNLGTFVITNVRVVWFADMAENFNVSIPYMQMQKVRVRDSKFGKAFVIETSEQSGGYILGFRLDPPDMLDRVFKEISSLHRLYSAKPEFGVEFIKKEAPTSLELTKSEQERETVEIIDSNHTDPLVAYYADGKNKSKDRKIVFCEELGLAVEELIEGFTIEDLWSIKNK